jgi:hypothetical protein
MSWFAFVPHIVAYLLALWLGSFLLARDPSRPTLRNAGLGLVVYAAALAGLLVSDVLADSDAADRVHQLTQPLLFLPSILWAGTLVHLLPFDAPYRRVIATWWRFGLPVLIVGFVWIGAGTEWIFAADGSIKGTGYLIAGAIAIAPLLEALLLIGFGFLRAGKRLPIAVLGVGLLLVALSTSLLMVPADLVPRAIVQLAIGFDLLLLGLTVAALDAFSEGEAWLPELLRSLAGSAVAVVAFVGPIVVTMAFGTGLDAVMAALVLLVGASAVLSQTFGGRVQAALDDLAYRPFPRIRKAQSELRTAALAEVRVADVLDHATMDEDEFARLTRVALSHLGNLPKLAASPLTRFVLVDQELDTLERAAVLRRLLAESVDRLRPPNVPAGTFHNGEHSRHFNALFYPYVVGLRPYSRRATNNGLTADARSALAWFQVNVPERTLYNWQSSAAKLVAKDLLERAGEK